MRLYAEYPKGSTPKVSQPINALSKVTGHKINIQKSNSFLYTNNELSERESKKSIPFKIVSKRINTKAGKDLYSENNKTLIQKIKNDTKK